MTGLVIGLCVVVYLVGYMVAATLLTLYFSDAEVDWPSVAVGAVWGVWWPVALPLVLPSLLVFWIAKKLRSKERA